MIKTVGTYCASRTHHAPMWRRLREDGFKLSATWIDEAGPGQTPDLGALWSRIRREVTSSSRFVLYAEPADFPLKGALVEAGMALAAIIPICVVLPGVVLDQTSLRPIGSWVRETTVRIVDTLDEAFLGADLSL